LDHTNKELLVGQRPSNSRGQQVRYGRGKGDQHREGKTVGGTIRSTVLRNLGQREHQRQGTQIR